MPSTKSDGAPSTWPQGLALALLLVGITSISASLVWPSFSSGQSAWSEEQARRYQAASANLHGLSHKYEDQLSGSKAAGLSAELKQAQSEYDQLRTQLDSARSQPNRIAFLLRILGILASMVGALLYFGAGKR